MTKKYVYQKYVEACGDDQYLSKHMWYITWNEFCSNVVIQKPRSDLCEVCQQSVTSIGKLSGMPEDVKKEKIQESLQHLNNVQNERSYYKRVIAESVQSIPSELLSTYLHTKLVPCSSDHLLHISFDYAQQVLIPCDGRQIGPLYFLAGYKVALFGIAVEPVGKFFLYIIPEACNTGKGANCVISLLHHFFDNFTMGKNELFVMQTTALVRTKIDLCFNI